MAVALAGLCVAVYAALARALRPTQAIGTGLKQLAANDLSARLPRFDLAELSAVSDVFNTLAQRLQATLAERNALTRKLIDVQDEERRRLARELHDEFGQSLTAIAAQAAAAAHTAERECPSLLEECRSISRMTAGLMDTLRGALVRLRPPDVEELGLTLSLESLVASWNGFEKGRTRFDIAVIGKVDELPPGVCANLYRVAQEAITNAAKHAQARRVQLRIEAAASDIVLTVEDDGEAAASGSGRESRHGTARHAGAGGLARRNAALRTAGERRRPAGRQYSQHGCGAMSATGTGGHTRVMLVDDHAIVREGYRSLLQKQDRLRVVAEADDGAEAYRIYKEVKPDLVIMDLSMPGIGGVEAIRRIRQWDKSAVSWCSRCTRAPPMRCRRSRPAPAALSPRATRPTALLHAIAEVMAGRIALSPDIDHELAMNRLADEPSAVDALSPREFEILRMLLAEKSVDDIADTLHISVKTAANTRYQIRAKLGVSLRHRTGPPGAAPADHRGGGYGKLGNARHHSIANGGLSSIIRSCQCSSGHDQRRASAQTAAPGGGPDGSGSRSTLTLVFSYGQLEGNFARYDLILRTQSYFSPHADKATGAGGHGSDRRDWGSLLSKQFGAARTGSSRNLLEAGCTQTDGGSPMDGQQIQRADLDRRRRAGGPVRAQHGIHHADQPDQARATTHRSRSSRSAASSCWFCC